MAAVFRAEGIVVGRLQPNRTRGHGRFIRSMVELRGLRCTAIEPDHRRDPRSAIRRLRVEFGMVEQMCGYSRRIEKVFTRNG
jgi:hypothetical protein